MSKKNWWMAAGAGLVAFLGYEAYSHASPSPPKPPAKPPLGGTPVITPPKDPFDPLPGQVPADGNIHLDVPGTNDFGTPGGPPIEHDPHTSASVSPVPGDPPGTVRRVVDDPLTGFGTPVDADGHPTGFPAPPGVPATAIPSINPDPSSEFSGDDFNWWGP